MIDNNLFTCVQCGNSFYITDKEMEWYTDRGLYVPRRCPLCREQNRLSGRTIPKPIPAPAPVLVHTSTEPARIFFAHLVKPNRTKAHGNAKYHIFNEHGKAKCSCNAGEEQSLYTDVTLIQPDASEMCVSCMKKTTRPLRSEGEHTHSTKNK